MQANTPGADNADGFPFKIEPAQPVQ